jgi:hypothetical protein
VVPQIDRYDRTGKILKRDDSQAIFKHDVTVIECLGFLAPGNLHRIRAERTNDDTGDETG